MRINPAVSVIIPAYNAALYVSEAIQSALQQSMSDIEVLVVDNLSTDDTVHIAESFEDTRVHVINCEKSSAGAARNVGLKNANGRYIQFLDADDILHSEKLQRQLDAITTRDPIRTVASCTWMRFDQSPKDAELVMEDVWPIEKPIDWLVNSWSGGGMMQTGAWLVHRDLIEAAGPWNETLSLHDDGEFFTRVLLQAESQIFVPEARIYYRSVADSLSRRRTRESIKSAFKVCQLRERHLLAAEDSRRVRAAIATQYAQFAYEFAGTEQVLARCAVDRIKELGKRPVNSVGGARFRKLTGIIGFRRSLALRKMVGYLSSPFRQFRANRN